MKLPAPGPALFFGIAAVCVALDQWTKHLVIVGLADGRDIEIIPRCFHLIHRTNTGAAFSMFESRTAQLAVFSALVATGIAVWALRFLPPREHFLRYPLAMIFGGAIGNLIDRAFRGHVVDFIDWHWDDRHFPTFNVADSFITVGMTIVIVTSVFFAPAEELPTEPDPEAAKPSKGKPRSA